MESKVVNHHVLLKVVLEVEMSLDLFRSVPVESTNTFHSIYCIISM